VCLHHIVPRQINVLCLQHRNNVIQTGSPEDLKRLGPRSSSNWGNLVLQQHTHESDILRHRSSNRDTDRRMLADVWQQSLYDDEGHVTGADGYDVEHGGGMQGVPAMARPDEEEAEEEHQAGDTFMVSWAACLLLSGDEKTPSDICRLESTSSMHIWLASSQWLTYIACKQPHVPSLQYCLSLRIKACTSTPLHQMTVTCLYALASLAVLLAHVTVQQTVMILMVTMIMLTMTLLTMMMLTMIILTMIMLTMPGLRTLQATPWGGPPRPSGGDSLPSSSGAPRHQLPAAPG